MSREIMRIIDKSNRIVESMKDSLLTGGDYRRKTAISWHINAMVWLSNNGAHSDYKNHVLKNFNKFGGMREQEMSCAMEGFRKAFHGSARDFCKKVQHHPKYIHRRENQAVKNQTDTKQKPTGLNAALVPERGAYVVGVLDECGNVHVMGIVEHKRLGERSGSEGMIPDGPNN